MRSDRSTMILAIAALLVAAGPADAKGPPWISVEIPSNPHHPTTRDATFLIRAYHHSTQIDVPVVARAEGMVKGERKSIDLEVRATNQAGVYAVRGVPATGTWLAVVRLTEGSASATALVSIGPDARVLSVSVPSDRTRDGWLVPRTVTPAEIEAELLNATRLAQALVPQPAVGTKGAALPIALLPLGLIAITGIGLQARRSDR